ncbi:MAG: IPT/TIG domain-containing protein [Deltaproteobacteria bacterium]|nr:IPT/TIG domain-containing protein [Deltaproteobacteria bacterium]MBW1870540.1 IPT/TIG domain-containing protein [Deltaproteobacteria bacterium]
MKKSIFLTVLLIFTAYGCSRDFSPPPALPTITGFTDPGSGQEDSTGFMDDLVNIDGSGFESQAENNLVFFGTESAKIVAADENQITVEVPQLETGERVFVKVSTSTGQATSPNEFSYLGPGHPLNESLDHLVRVKSGPIALTPGRYQYSGGIGTPPPVFVANTWSRTMGTLDLTAKTHYGVGVGFGPVSLAKTKSALDQQLAYVISLQASSIPTRMQYFPINILTGTIRFVNPQDVTFPDIDKVPFLPARVWSFCKISDCSSYALAVFDLYRPLMAIIEPGEAAPSAIVKVDGSLCPNTPEEAKPFIDLVRHTSNDINDEANRMLAILADQPEIWSIRDTVEPPCNFRVWPIPDSPTEPPEDPDWERAFSSIALCNGGNSLYVADARNLEVIEFDVFAGGPGGVQLSPTDRSAPIPGYPFAMTCGIGIEPDGETAPGRLYVATEEGIVVLDTAGLSNSEIEQVDFINLPTSQGGPQSLALIKNRDTQDDNKPLGDSIVYADLLGDRVLIIPVGAESSAITQIPVGSPIPQIAPSRFNDMLYLADPHSNVLSLIDQNTGLFTAQFLANEINSFGASNIASTSVGGREALLIPLPPPLDHGPDCNGYTRLIVRLAEGKSSFDDWGTEWREQGYNQVSTHMFDADAHGCFQEILPAPRRLEVFLVRYGLDAKVWSMGLNGQAPDMTELIGMDIGTQLDYTLDSDIKIVRLSSDENYLAAMAGSDLGNPRIIAINIDDPSEVHSFEIYPFTAMFTTDLAFKIYQNQSILYLALPALGEVVALGSGSTVNFIQTAGAPFRLFLSPDGRRLYATQSRENRVSIIDTGCQPLGACERVLRNLDLEAYPAEIVFHPSGERAYATHMHPNAVSIIE